MKRLIALSSATAVCLSLATPLQAQEAAASSSAAGSSAVIGGKTLLILVFIGVGAIIAGANSN